MLMSQPRIFFAMSRDGLLPRGVSKVHPKFGTPYLTTIITCVVVAAIAGVTEISDAGNMTSIGTLFAFLVVSAAVLILRVQRPDAVRPFRVPGGPIIPVLGILSCLYLMLSLPVITWIRFLGWLDIGIFIYWFYGRTHSPLANQVEQQSRPAAVSIGNFVQMLGGLITFNGFFMTLLGYMTEFGITTETTARWHEIGVTPEESDTLGLQVLITGIVVFVVGRLISRSAGKPQAV
jgi:amino acid transporter